MKKILKNERVIHGLAALIVLGKKMKKGVRQSFSKRTIIIAAIAIVFVATGVGTTFALLRVQAQGEVTNAFQSAKINVQVVEENPTGEEIKSDTKNLVPFGSITTDERKEKKVWIENVYSENYPTTDTFVRCRVVPILRDDVGNNIAVQVDYELISENADDSDKKWKLDETSGYYYWTAVLPKGERTGTLFESVKVKSQVPEGAHLELQVLVDAVQARPYADNFRSLSDDEKKKIPVYDAWGWYYDTADGILKN